MVKADCRELVAGPAIATMGRIAAMAVLAGLLSACSLVRLGTPDAIFDLSAPDKVSSRAGTPAQLLIPVPAASAALDTARIAARPTDSEYAYLPGAVALTIRRATTAPLRSFRIMTWNSATAASPAISKARISMTTL